VDGKIEEIPPLRTLPAMLPGPSMERFDRFDEGALTELARRGRRDAWQALVARHDHRVVLSLLARGIPLDRAREIAQDTWARLIEQQRAGRLERLELPGLAIAQAGFFALEDRRRRGRDIPIEEAPDATSVPDPATSAEERLVSRAQLEAARAELARCSSAARGVFHLVYDNPGVPHAEAARHLGLSVQRVRQTLCEVRAKLRAALEATDE